MNTRLKLTLYFTLFFMVPSALYAAPQITQAFPSRPALLGEPLLWIIELRYPLWESYTLKVNPCRGAEIGIKEQKLVLEAGEIRSTIQMRILPQNLRVETPSVVISDEKGQSTVVNGKALSIYKISGTSLDIKAPGTLMSQRPQTRNRVLYVMLVFLTCVLLFLIIRRKRANTLQSILQRDLRKALLEVQKERLPVQLWRLLRAELLWGFAAEPFTPAQLKTKAQSDPRLVQIAEMLQSLEACRYSGVSVPWDKTAVEKSLWSAMELLKRRRALPFVRNFRKGIGRSLGDVRIRSSFFISISIFISLSISYLFISFRKV